MPGILEKMLKALEKSCKLEDSILFAHIKQKESDAEQKETDSTAMRTRIKDALLTAIEKMRIMISCGKIRILETGGKIQGNIAGLKAAWRHSVVQFLQA